MSTSQNPEVRENAEVNAAVALTKEEVDALSPAQRADIADRKARNLTVAKIAATNWGKGMDDATRRAVADWGQRNGVDVVTEIHVLGGNIYLNHVFYLNRLLEMRDRGEVLDYGHRFINVDARLDASDPADKEEIRLRRQLRIHHGVPDKAEAAVLFHVVFKVNPGTRIEGCKWTGGGTRKGDPVGDNFPQETAISRAARRCLKYGIATLPPRMRAWIEAVEDDAVGRITEVLEASHDRQKLERAEAAQIARGTPIQPVHAEDYARALPAGAPPDFLSAQQPGYVAPVMRPAQPSTEHASVHASVREIPDPYGQDAARTEELAERAAGAEVVAARDEPAPEQPPVSSVSDSVSDSVSAGADLFQDDTDLLTPAERRELDERKAREKRRGR